MQIRLTTWRGFCKVQIRLTTWQVQIRLTTWRPLGDHLAKDRHVLAAALACKGDCLVTFNLKDFPASAGDATAVVGPYAFLKCLWQREGSVLLSRLEEQAAAIGVSKDELLARLAQSVPSFVELVRNDTQGMGIG